MKSRILNNWYLKAAFQKTISFVPCRHRINYFFQVNFGKLKAFDTAKIINEIKEAYLLPIAQGYGSKTNLKITELGTGWMPVLPTLLSLMGNTCSSFDVARLFDTGKIKDILKEIEKYSDYLEDIPDFSFTEAIRKYKECDNGNILKHLGWDYFAPIDTCNLPLEDNSQDLVVSRLVLQHIPQNILPSAIKETWRILKPGGRAIHKINLHDEYAESDPGACLINFLKFPEWFWNSFVNNKIKFVNQARYPYYLRVFEDAGFRILKTKKVIDKQSLRDIDKIKLAKEFRQYSKEELATVGLYAVLQK
ncbi:methyltransferase domain-containing protein [Candidatus Omnitrophota bacterium]